nr:hypothetical protein [Tanacetum cinerariifolium]
MFRGREGFNSCARVRVRCDVEWLRLTDESIWYGYTLDVQRMSRYGIVVHIRFMVYSSIQRLQALEREVEEMADEKMLSIEKLKGNVPFE